jgi:protein involved in temperature-dependent protein secretion
MTDFAGSRFGALADSDRRYQPVDELISRGSK